MTVGCRQKAVFLDRDGTLNAEKAYLSDPERLEILPGVPEGLKQLQDAGWLLFIVTNQSGIGRGLYTEADMHAVHRRLEQRLGDLGIRFQKIYFAPEAPGQPSRGRKPSPQFVWDARDEFNLDLSQSYFIGDKLLDLQCGWNAGVKRCILVRTGYGAETEAAHPAEASRAWVVDNLAEAAKRILQAESSATSCSAPTQDTNP
jgi:D-glycero-D-manno-heptose 1,7-bisphosphate phosphatase